MSSPIFPLLLTSSSPHLSTSSSSSSIIQISLIIRPHLIQPSPITFSLLTDPFPSPPLSCLFFLSFPHSSFFSPHSSVLLIHSFSSHLRPFPPLIFSSLTHPSSLLTRSSIQSLLIHPSSSSFPHSPILLLLSSPHPSSSPLPHPFSFSSPHLSSSSYPLLTLPPPLPLLLTPSSSIPSPRHPSSSSPLLTPPLSSPPGRQHDHGHRNYLRKD